MSKYLERIDEILKNASSKKITDKRRCVVELVELYDNKEAIAAINKNSQRDAQGTICWSYIVHMVHKMVLEEAERIARKDSSNKASVMERQRTWLLVQKTFQHAVSCEVPLLKWKDAIPLTLQVLGSSAYDHYHDTYVNVLVSYLLPIRTYQMEIKPEYWQELLKSCLKLYKRASSLTSKRAVLECLQMIFRYGCAHFILSVDVKEVVRFLENMFLDAKMSEEILAEVSYKLTNTVCQQIAVEHRVTLCHFSESVLPSIISLKGSAEKYKLLLLFVRMHHPRGAGKADDGAFAGSWETWRTILESIYAMTLKDLEASTLSKMKDLEASTLSKSFLRLAAAVFKLVLQDPEITEKESFDDCDYLLPAKRSRTVYSVTRPVDLLTNSSKEEARPMILVLTTLFQTYPECLKSEDYPEFLTILEDLALSSKKEDTDCCLYELATVLLTNEKICSAADIERSNICWEKIWNILLRSLNGNQNEDSIHRLAQLLIARNKVRDVTALLQLYLRRTIKWSPISLRTLTVICQNSFLPTDAGASNATGYSPPTDSTSVRVSLVKWILLNIPWQKPAPRIPIDELCWLLIAVALKSKPEKSIGAPTFTDSRRPALCDCSKAEHRNDDEFFPEHVERCYLLLAYKQALFAERREEDCEEKTKASERVSVVESVIACLVTCLGEILSETSAEGDLHARITKIALVAKIASTMKQVNVISPEIEDSPLVQAMSKSLSAAYALLETLDSKKSKYAYLCNATKALCVLYETRYDAALADVIVSSATLDTLKNVFVLMNLKDSEIVDYKASNTCYNDYDSFQNRRKFLDDRRAQECTFCSKGTVRIQTTRALALFCCMNAEQEKREIQIKLMNNLLDTEMYDLSDTVNCKMAVTVLELLARYDGEVLWSNHRDAPVENLLQLYEKCYRDQTLLRSLLSVLPYFFKYAIDHSCKVDDLMGIVAKLNKLFSKNRYSFGVREEFVKCLSEMIRVAPSHLYYTTRDSMPQVPIVEGVLSSLISCSFAVQVQVISCVREIYSSKSVAFECKEILYNKIEEAIQELRFEDDSSDWVEVDKKETATASSLLILAAIVSSNGPFQCRALVTMLRFIVDRRLDSGAIAKAIGVLGNDLDSSSLLQDNFSYLLTDWFNSEYSSKPFPWQLTRCKSEEEFYRAYSSELAFIKFQSLKLGDLADVCERADLSFAQVTENIFPQMLTWLIYCTNGNAGEASKKLACKPFHELISNQNEFAEVRKFSSLFSEKFEQTLVYLFERLHDEDYLEETLGARVSFPNSDPPCFKKAAISGCLRYMEDHLLPQKASTQYVLACSCPSALQRILFRLNSNIYERKGEERKTKAFHQYAFFCALIADELTEAYFDDLSAYLVKDIGYSLLHIVKAFDGVLGELACKYLHRFAKQILPERSAEAKEILNFAVTTLIPVAQTQKISAALQTLRFLLVDQKDVFRNAIEKLNSFPNHALFKEIRAMHADLRRKTKKICGLEEEARSFLCATHDKDAHCNAEDVAHLRLQLSTRKDELRQLYENLETFRGFSEDCASSVLHQLVYKLIKLTSSSDLSVSIEAAKCLGELGPTDLTSMILYLEKSHVKESSDLIEILSYKVTLAMVRLLFHSDIQLRKVSADVLYVGLSSCWGQKLTNAKYMEHLRSVLGDAEAELPLRYVKPFLPSKPSKATNVGINYARIEKIVDPRNDIWTVRSDGSYRGWISALACEIAKCFTGFYAQSLIPMCALSTDFCELVLPRLIFLIIHTDKKYTSSICACIDRFFEHAVCECPACDHRIARCMLNIVNYVRMQISSDLLSLNYSYIAKAAQDCSAFFTAILYAEMACEAILNDDENIGGGSKIDYVCEVSSEQGKVIQNILRDSYAKIGDFDAISGTGSSHLRDRSTLVQHYLNTSRWDKAILMQDIELSFGNPAAIRDMANGLHRFGFQYLLGNFISSTRANSTEIEEGIDYEFAWQLSDWSLLQTNPAASRHSKVEVSERDYHFYHYSALKCLHEGNEQGIREGIQNARISVTKALRNISLESSKTVYEKLMQLQLIREIEELSLAKESEYETVLRKWEQQEIANFNEFRYMEPILTQRIVMFQINDTLIHNEKTKSALADTYLQLSKIAADKGNLHVASRSLGALAKRSDLPPKIQDQLLYQESLLARLDKDLDVGRFHLRSLLQKESLDANLRAQILRVYGDWMAEMKSENPQTVIKSYYSKSIDMSSSISPQTSDSIKTLHDAQVALARFADDQFEQISTYMKSAQFEYLKECIAYSNNIIHQHSVPEDKDIRSAMFSNQKQNTNDLEELEHIQKERDNYLILAFKYYLKVVRQSESHNLLIFRIVALWLDNALQPEINDLLQENLNEIPSFKFIPLVPQLAAHMNNNLTQFSEKIYNIMQRCALQHPHHALPVLLALKNLYGDQSHGSTRRDKGVEPRVLGARKLLQELAKSNVKSIVEEMEKLSRALVSLANLPAPSKNPGTMIKIPRNQEILQIKGFENIFVPTLTIGVKPSGNYSDVTGIAKYVETYETVGGINTPKKLVCVGTDGVRRNQLIKGKDDLRQDAVMQQVFNVMNILLKSDKETKRRKLAIRTYKIVPLTQRSGILEWCDNTTPLIVVLLGENGASGLHKKYYPKDYTSTVCKKKIMAVVKSSTEVKMKAYMDCCAHMHPVMHHFFTEKYPSPETWFERRLAYTRSVATTSMAGYILGLGDRHLNNILIDQTTAEVIHIDFGIAFEQGKVLPVPETIPFRLTRNIEAGMGVSGVEGTMKRCCEKTLTVLRDQRQVIITLLQVLLYDPLFKWTITPAKAHDIQTGSTAIIDENNQCSTGTNKTAERALLRIEQKLRGTEEGLQSSVDGQVERLVQQARDPINLCRLYYGWQPYL